MCNKVIFYSLFTKKSGEKWGNVGENDYLCSQTHKKSNIKEIRMRFLGNIEAKIDVKGRAFLPATFRKVLQAGGEERLVLRKDVFQACLVLYPESVWNEQMDLLRSRLNRWNRQEQQVFRQFVSEVELVTLDGNGRFLIPKRYLRMAEIDQDIKFVGMDDTIEIWSSRKVEEQQMKPEDFGNALEQLMMVEQE
jgi:MraZ protein